MSMEKYRMDLSRSFASRDKLICGQKYLAPLVCITDSLVRPARSLIARARGY